MPKPIYKTDEMAEELAAFVREEFEKEFAKEFGEGSTAKMANGEFKFTFRKPYYWANDKSRATLRISPEAFSQMMLLIQSTNLEVGWHGIIKRVEEGKSDFLLENIILYPQTVTSATIDADQEKYPLWAMQLPDEQFNNLRFHGHSHVMMATSPSGVDMGFREQLLGQFKDGFYVFLIINKKLETTCQVYDLDMNSLYDNNEVDIIIGDNLGSEIGAANREMVVTKVYSYPSTYPSASTMNRGQGSKPGKAGFRSSYDDDEDWRNHWRDGDIYN